MSSVQVGILGPLVVRDGDGSIELRRGHPRTLLIALVLRARETVSPETLIDVLWGDDQPRNPLNALHVQISHLRKALAEHAASAHVLRTEPTGYCLAIEPNDLDACLFEALVDRAQRDLAGARPEAALEHIDEALDLWRGEALCDVANEPFARGDVTRLTEARWHAIEMRNDIRLELGRHRELTAELRQLVDDQPLRERFHEQLILSLYRSGRQGEALRAYEHARSVLVEELGIDPGAGLRDLERAILEQALELDWPNGPAQHRTHALPTAGSRPFPNRIPVPISPLIGRAVETERTMSLLERNRLLTLTGPGGAGKTRLAVEVATRVAETDAVWYVDLGAIRGNELVAATVSAAVGVPSTPDEDPIGAISLSLATERGLLVLDTCEHVLDGAADIAVRVLEGCPHVRILATSRRPLGIPAEIGWPVPPLALPSPRITDPERLMTFPSVELFAARAAAVRPGFEVSETNAADVASICLALDGLPLAIELAAGRSDLLTAASIGARLQNRFDLLVGASRGAVARQHTLRSAVDWSYELLEPQQQEFFAHLGVFHGSFDLDAATAVAGPGCEDAVELLTALVRHSMVAVVGDDRYRLLDTLRAYAIDRSPHAVVEAAERHARHYMELAERAEAEIVGPDQVTWLAKLRADVPNLRAAVRWAFQRDEREVAARLVGSLAWFWTLRGMLAEAADYLDQASRLPDLPGPLQSKVLRGHALLAASIGRLEVARHAAAQSCHVAGRSGEIVERAHALNALAVTEWSLGDLRAAASAHDEAIELLQGSDEFWILGVCMALRARTALDARDPAGLDLAKAALPIARRSGDRHVIGIAFEQIALHLLGRGRVREAIDAAHEALASHEAIGYTEGTVAALHVLARALAAAGDLDPALGTHREALFLAHRIGHVAGMCEALEGLATGKLAAGQPQEAARFFAAAEAGRAANQIPVRLPDRDEIDRLRTAVEPLRIAAGDALNGEEASASLEATVSQLIEAETPWPATADAR